MGWGLFGQIVLLIVIYVLLKNMMKCMHDKYCTVCKK